ncbi:MAG: alpha/beta hydrolase [Sphingobacteriales bacterium]|nr:alpha/beta hydrolase [Sphingobacteriales bacterium]MBI3718729.1 alpha/beta hydrolase [Sphingobacteriales bacterium]
MQKQINYHQSTVYYNVIGSGKPVVPVHGFGEDSEVWKYQVDFLKDKFQLIIPDLPGSGLSKVDSWSRSGSGTVGSNYLSIEWLADCIKAILDTENISSCSLIGHSMGGYITLAFAEKYPDLLNKFGLLHSTAYADSEEKIQTRRRGIEFIKEHGAYAFLKQSTPNLFGKKFSEEHPEAITELIERNKLFAAEALIQYYEAMIARPDRTAVLKNTAIPFLHIIGAEDKAAPLKDCLEQCHLPAITYVTILEQSAHMGMWEETNKANKALAAFLEC